MFFLRFILVCACGSILMAGCAKSDDDQTQAANSPTTRPDTSGLNAPVQPAAIAESPTTAPAASDLVIAGTNYWFPPARLRLSTSDGKIVARLYSDDPRGVLTGNETVNSYDIMMVLPNITDPADITKTAWVDHSASMEKQDSPYGIFLNNQQDVLQPTDVTVQFRGQAPHIQVIVWGTFGRFHISDQTPHPAPVPVLVKGILDATIPTAN